MHRIRNPAYRFSCTEGSNPSLSAKTLAPALSVCSFRGFLFFVLQRDVRPFACVVRPKSSRCAVFNPGRLRSRRVGRSFRVFGDTGERVAKCVHADDQVECADPRNENSSHRSAPLRHRRCCVHQPNLGNQQVLPTQRVFRFPRRTLRGKRREA